MTIRFEPEVYEIAKKLLENQEDAISLLKALRTIVKSLTITLEIKPEYVEEKPLGN